MAADVVMGGAAAAVAKSVGGAGDAPARKPREMLKRGHQRRPYRAIADRLLRVLGEESLLSLWRGNQANVIRYFPTQLAADLLEIDETKIALLNYGEITGGKPFSLFHVKSAVIIFSGVCAYSSDTLHRRMTLSSRHTSKYNSTFHALQHKVCKEGFSARFRGAATDILPGIAGAGVLVGYDQLHQIARRHAYGVVHQRRGA